MREYLRGRDEAPWRSEWGETADDEPPAVRRWLQWWWRMTAPEEPGNGASLAERERARIGRLTSAILFAVIVLTAAARGRSRSL